MLYQAHIKMPVIVELRPVILWQGTLAQLHEASLGTFCQSPLLQARRAKGEFTYIRLHAWVEGAGDGNVTYDKFRTGYRLWQQERLVEN